MFSQIIKFYLETVLNLKMFSPTISNEGKPKVIISNKIQFIL